MIEAAHTEHWKIRCICDPDIHPEDFSMALRARLASSGKRRKTTSIRTIIEDLFLASVANCGNEWSAEQIEQIRESSKDPKFRERFARALAQEKSRTLDKFDVFILKNWRELHLPAVAQIKYGSLPGLRDWSPKAVAGLLEHGGIRPSSENLEAWFTKRRKRLGLTPIIPYSVMDFIAIGDKARVKVRK